MCAVVIVIVYRVYKLVRFVIICNYELQALNKSSCQFKHHVRSLTHDSMFVNVWRENANYWTQWCSFSVHMSRIFPNVWHSFSKYVIINTVYSEISCVVLR
jgi:hypothetical protein